ncbi:leucine-rich_repeat domain-containing protein [Hexamita inflata]|uniref:Leucine-rich_repeat domain-containing protein n=1 Tax=Hexamita inflata TaxID=28002 RepID=A0ABP1JUR2_9EUKA
MDVKLPQQWHCESGLEKPKFDRVNLQTKNYLLNGMYIKFHSNMGSHLGQPSYEKEKDSKSKAAQYNKTMIDKYQNQIREGMLIIDSKPELNNLDFIRFLKVNTLVLGSCRSIIPKFYSQTIKQLRIYSYDNISLNVFQLDNLEVLTLQSNDINKSKTLVLEIIQFQKLKELYLCGWITDISPLLQLRGLTQLGLYSCQSNIQIQMIDVSTIQQMTNLTTLALNDCKVRNASVLQRLIYLEELCLDQNQGIDITALQYLTKLTKLSLRSCDLVGLDSLMPLIKLKDLNIQGNKIIYIQPLAQLKNLSQLDARYNNIIEAETIQQHQNYQSFLLGAQYQPTKAELKEASMMRCFNTPVTFLKQMQKQSRNLYALNHILRKNIITKSLQMSYYNHTKFIASVAVLLQMANIVDQ